MNYNLSLNGLPVVDERVMPDEGLIESVTVIFSDITRYPKEIIEPHADLETDLGIDSVKFGEIFAALRDRYALPGPAVMKTFPPERFRTVAGIAGLIAELTGNGANTAIPLVKEADDAPVRIPLELAVPAAAKPQSSGTPIPLSGISDESLLAEVTQTFADMTRYPVDVLTPDADFEHDLGIDSVKLGEILAVLRDKYQLPSAEVLRERWKLESIRSIRGVVSGIALLREPTGQSDIARQATPTVLSTKAISRAGKFAGKIALITGSGRGLGRDLALHLGGLGVTVLVNSFHSRQAGETTTEEITKAGGIAHHFWGSVANPTHLHKMFDTIESEFGGLDFLICNASNGLLAPIDKIQAEHWEKALRTNVIGLHQCALRARPLMKARGGGRIVTMSSVAAHRYVDYFGCMGPIKAAVEALTKYLAVEFQADNILVNCVSATAVYGELVEKWPDRDRLVPVWEKGAGGRLCTGADVANLVEYVLGEGASMVNGSILVMDGGQTARG